jgi:hypothetical protein
MKTWPLPNFNYEPIKVTGDTALRDWYNTEVFLRDIRPREVDFDLPLGWSNVWPDLPEVDNVESHFDLDNVKLSKPTNHCSRPSLLGYYISWHLIGISFKNEKGRLPYDGNELSIYHESLPIENRYGIHICNKAIEGYISKFSTEGLSSHEVPMYLDYCTYLTLIYVIAHEWGHYRSEVLSFQIGKLMKSVSGKYNHPMAPSFLSYYVDKKSYRRNNFEEVFAEWAALKMGIFNYHMKKPQFAISIPNWPKVEATVKLMLSKAISNPRRSRPYSDIRFWLDFDALGQDSILSRVSSNKPSLNRSVNDNVLFKRLKSLKKVKMIDFLMHNQMQFSNARNSFEIIRSSSIVDDLEPDSLFYHFGDDECCSTTKQSSTNGFLKLANPIFSNSSQRDQSRVLRVIESLKSGSQEFAVLPIKVFNEFLPLDEVYFHNE